MTTPYIFGIFVLFSFLFLIVGIVARVITKNTTMSLLIFISGILFLLTSLMVLGDGIPERIGFEEGEMYIYGDNFSLDPDHSHWIHDTTPPNVNEIYLFRLNRTTTPINAYQDSIFINALGIILLLLSLVLFYASVFDLATGDGL